jgi:NADH:ubiquinone oxidoreductase subunit 3 (subunit A)
MTTTIQIQNLYGLTNSFPWSPTTFTYWTLLYLVYRLPVLLLLPWVFSIKDQKRDSAIFFRIGGTPVLLSLNI